MSACGRGPWDPGLLSEEKARLVSDILAAGSNIQLQKRDKEAAPKNKSLESEATEQFKVSFGGRMAGWMPWHGVS